MPRGVRRINNGPVDVPVASQEGPGATEATKPYETTGRGIETLAAAPIAPFGPGANYPRITYHTRLYDPANGATYQFTMSDTDLALWQGKVDSAIETGLVPCPSPDAPKLPRDDNEPSDVGRVSRRSPVENPATPRQRETLVKFRSPLAEYDDLTFEEASAELDKLISRARERTGRRY